MARTKAVLEPIQQTTAVYRQELDRLTMEQLRWKPSEEEWSIGQMLRHLIDSALGMQLRHVEQCIACSAQTEAATGEEANKSPDVAGKTKQGEAVFARGSFPPERIHVPPSPMYTPVQPETKEELVEGFGMVIRRMQELEPLLPAASEACTVAHPRLGALNATEWFLLVEMHFRHHLRQLERLKPLVTEAHSAG